MPWTDDPALRVRDVCLGSIWCSPALWTDDPALRVRDECLGSILCTHAPWAWLRSSSSSSSGCCRSRSSSGCCCWTPWTCSCCWTPWTASSAERGRGGVAVWGVRYPAIQCLHVGNILFIIPHIMHGWGVPHIIPGRMHGKNCGNM